MAYIPQLVNCLLISSLQLAGLGWVPVQLIQLQLYLQNTVVHFNI